MDWLGDGALSDTTTWGLILGVVLPWLTAVVQQPSWSTGVRKAVGLAAAVVGGVITCLANGSLDEGQTLLATIAAVLIASQATYRGLWKAPDTPRGTGRGVPDDEPFTRRGQDRLALATVIEYKTSGKRHRSNDARAA